MTSKVINNKQFREAIRTSFDNDPMIFPMYNPNVPVKNVDDIVDDISSRVCTSMPEATIKGVFDKNNLIGYFVFHTERKALISFGLNVGYRKRKCLNEMWSLIRRDLNGVFQCFLFTRNIRGIKWLQKNDMSIIAADNLVTQLIFTKCQ